MTTFVAGGLFGASTEINEPYSVQSIASLASGGFVLIYNTSGSLFAEIHGADGQRIGSPIAFASSGFSPAIVGLASGGFAVGWQDSASNSVKTQVFSADGAPLGEANTINGAGGTSSYISAMSLAARSDGSFEASWNTGSGTFARLIDGNNHAASGIIQLSQSADQTDVAVLSNGHAVVASSNNAAISGQPVKLNLSLLSADGSTVESQNWISIPALNTQAYYALQTHVTALASGALLVNWTEYSGGFNYVTHARIYDSSGTLISSGFDTAGISGRPVVLGDGKILFSFSSGSGQGDINEQIYDTALNAVGSSFALNDPTDAGQFSVPVQTSFGTGDVAAAWSYGFDSALRLYYNATDGTAGDDILNGTDSVDILRGLAGNDVLHGLAGDDILIGGAGADILDGGAGNDTANYADSAAGVTLSLVTGIGHGGDAEGDTLTSIENLVGSAFADTLTGDAGANTLDGGAGDDILIGGPGADVLIGGAGIDTASYATSSTGVTVNLATGTGVGGDAQGDTLSGIENVTGSAFADTLIGNAGNNVLTGGAGDDTLIGGLGADTLDGGDGSDTASYAGSGAGVTINLAAGTASGGDATGDTLISIENIIGSAYADTIVGDAGANRLDGGAGDDSLSGGAGDDLLIGGAGADRLDGGDGNDTASYAGSAAGVTVNLTAGTGSGGDATGDTLISIENLIGSALADTLVGDAGANRLDGGAGDDILTGGLGADILTGGLGHDIFRDTIAGFNGDTITDFSADDKINITDASLSNFTFSLTGSTLQFQSGSQSGTITLGSVPQGHIVASAGTGAGVALAIQQTVAHNDFNGDGRSDALWRNDAGQLSNWLGQANGDLKSNDANAFSSVPTSWHVVGTGDFNGDGRADILWRNDNGQMSDWLSNASGGFAQNDANAFTTVGTTWHIAGTGDFNGDGRADILWRNDAGQLSDWLGTATGGFTQNDANAFTGAPTDWKVAGTGDFNGDGITDILWRNDDGRLSDWLGKANGGFTQNDVNAASSAPTNWHIVATGDFNGDGRDDILWRSDSGQLSDWLGTATGGFVKNDAAALTTVGTNWTVADVGDYNGDGKADILWQNSTGGISNWFGTAGGGFTNNDANAAHQVPTNWHILPHDSLV